MTTLMIKDLALAADLDGAAMSAVRGGCYKGYTPSYCTPSYPMPEYKMPSYGSPTELNVNASQLIGQSQSVVNNNGNNVAFASGITSTVNPTQSAHNDIKF
ncbi:hypothetical protein EGT07_12710 [Herbaspirillum sp. HC18]|nr:hypothetical protein EGT07_12685 [Herbaspirillum sp. HC18]RZI42838.1 hypothetical protein EGT07_12710 [Herbaspirillum sp. HC18]